MHRSKASLISDIHVGPSTPPLSSLAFPHAPIPCPNTHSPCARTHARTHRDAWMRRELHPPACAHCCDALWAADSFAVESLCVARAGRMCVCGVPAPYNTQHVTRNIQHATHARAEACSERRARCARAERVRGDGGWIRAAVRPAGLDVARQAEPGAHVACSMAHFIACISYFYVASPLLLVARRTSHAQPHAHTRLARSAALILGRRTDWSRRLGGARCACVCVSVCLCVCVSVCLCVCVSLCVRVRV